MVDSELEDVQTAVATVKESDTSLLKQMKQTALDSSEMDDSDIEDVVQTILRKALQDVFESKGVSRWTVCFPRKSGTQDRHFINIYPYIWTSTSKEE